MANLVIVESPAKANTIKSYLGSNYKVIASKGHIRDLPKSSLGIDVENGFEPHYINIRGKGDVIKELKKEAKSASKIAVENVVFSGMKQPSEPYETELFVKVRYLAPPISAKVTFYPDLTASVSLCTPVKSVTPGQSAVFYDGNRVVAGGFISKSE